MKADLSMSTTINKSPLNNSLSKACYSFGRSSKSPNEKKTKYIKNLCSDTIYDIPTMLSTRATFIGFGKKSEIAPKNFNPSPDKYDKQSDFSINLKKGISFGLSR